MKIGENFFAIFFQQIRTITAYEPFYFQRKADDDLLNFSLFSISMLHLQIQKKNKPVKFYHLARKLQFRPSKKLGFVHTL